jgi:hypothetical protein
MRPTSWSGAAIRRGLLVKAFFQDGPWLGLNPDTDLYKSNLIKNGCSLAACQLDAGDVWKRLRQLQHVTRHERVFLSMRQGRREHFADFAGGHDGRSVNKVHTLHFQIVGGGNITFGVGTRRMTALILR